MSSGRENQSASPEGGDRLEAYPRTLRDGRKRLVGVIDGFATYYDTRQHRIDVRIERFDGTYYVTGYYQLQRHESVADYVRTVEEQGGDCKGLSRWVERQLQPNRRLSLGWLRVFVERIERIVGAVR